MALPAHQIPRWFNSIKLSSFITCAQLGKCFQRPGKTLLHGFSAQPQMSSEDCFLQWGLKTYRTLSLWNNSQFTNSRKQEINSAQSTLLPSVNEQSQKTQNISSFDSELSLEGNSELSEKSPLPHFGSVNRLPVYILLAHFKSYFVPGKKKNRANTICLLVLYLYFIKKKVCRIICITLFYNSICNIYFLSILLFRFLKTFFFENGSIKVY